MTPEQLNLRVRQMHASLGDLSTADLSSVVSRSGVQGERFYVSVDFSDGVPDTALMNMADSLLNNIARLKDHLGVWCKAQNVTYDGDAVIDSTAATKLVHDLWNTEKHGQLNTRRFPTRSGTKPQLVEVRRAMVLSTGAVAGSATVMTFDRNGRPVVMTTGGGKAELVIDGDIVDEQGAHIAGFVETCEAAVTRWERALTEAGVPVPPR